MLWNEVSFYDKVVSYQATFFILQLMPLPNLPTQVLFSNTISKNALVYRCVAPFHLVSAIVYFCEVASHYNNNELFYLRFCLLNITEIYLPVICKFFLDRFVYSLCNRIL